MINQFLSVCMACGLLLAIPFNAVALPSVKPSASPNQIKTKPSTLPSVKSSTYPNQPKVKPTVKPTIQPTVAPTIQPTEKPPEVTKTEPPKVTINQNDKDSFWKSPVVPISLSFICPGAGQVYKGDWFSITRGIIYASVFGVCYWQMMSDSTDSDTAKLWMSGMIVAGAASPLDSLLVSVFQKD